MSSTVIVFIRQTYQAQREKMSGVYSAAIERGWQILPVDERFTPQRFRALKRLWNPIGCLVDATALSDGSGRPLRVAKADVLGLPTVFLGRDMTRKKQVFDCSAQNTRAPALLAVRTFRTLGLSQFVFIGDPGRPAWSEERRRHFERAVRSWDCQHYDGGDPGATGGQGELAGFLRFVPKPFGVLLAADHLALSFYAAVHKARLTIGEDLFVLGVDNDEMRCNSLSPTLSSIRLDYFQSGRNGIDILDRRLGNPSLPPQYITYGTIEAVKRASTTRRLPNRKISDGLVFIAEHGCERITTGDVAERMGCSRRMAEKLFRRHTGKSILDTIRETRLEKAKALLGNTHVLIDRIPAMCGYDSLPHFKTYFREQTGMTMREWRGRRLIAACRGS